MFVKPDHFSSVLIKKAYSKLKKYNTPLFESVEKYYLYLTGVIFFPPLNYVSIEINSACNRSCTFCPNSIEERPKFFLEEELFYKIIQDLKDIGFKGEINFNLYNEPLLDPRICMFMKHIKKELPSAYMYLNTNGDFLNITKWKELRDSGLSFANVTQYDGKINKNITKLIDALDAEEKKHIYAHELGGKHSRAGLVGSDYTGPLPLKEVCTRPFNQLPINWKGKVILCCNDYYGSVEIGDVRHEKISDIWEKSDLCKL